MTDIDDLGGGVVRDQPVEQSHLAFDAGNIRLSGVLRRKLRQRRFTFVEVESRGSAAFVKVKIRHQPRQYRLTDARARRCNDGD